MTFSVATLLLSIVVLTGYAGQISLAQYALAGIGGLIGAELTAHAGFGFLPALVCRDASARWSWDCACDPGASNPWRQPGRDHPCLRVGRAGHDLHQPERRRADVGINVGNASLFGLDVSGADQPARYAALTFLVFVICGVLVANLRRGRLGRRMIAVRSNERAAAASGIGVFRTKLIAFAVSGALAGPRPAS